MRYVSLTGNGWASGKSSVMSTDFTAEQRKGMLLAVHEREGSWDKVDPDTEIKNIACDIGVSEDESYELFKHLVDEGYIDPGRVHGAGGAMPGHTSRVVGREDNMTVIGDDVRLTSKGQTEIK